MIYEEFSDTQIESAVKLFEAGIPMEDIIWQLEISSDTFDEWKKLYGGREEDIVMHLMELEAEHTELAKKYDELKIMYADLCIEKQGRF